MRQHYRDFNFRPETEQMIALINALIADYQRQGFKLSVRQLYYQMVTRNVVSNTEQSYKRVASIINDGRLAGLIDWEAIEDRNRDVEVRSKWDSGSSIIESAARSFHMDMWVQQECRVFVIVEKAALAGVLEGVCHRYDVPMLAARGYPSVSIVREMCLEHFQPAMEAGQFPVVLHLGDHDPSGIDMTRDLRERIEMFSECNLFDIDEVEVKRIALTMPQIEEKSPPPNPAKTTDARFKEYRRRFGDESWELDALEPSYLVKLVTSHIERHIDFPLWEKRKEEIEDIRLRLDDAAAKFAEEGV